MGRQRYGGWAALRVRWVVTPSSGLSWTIVTWGQFCSGHQCGVVFQGHEALLAGNARAASWK